MSEAKAFRRRVLLWYQNALSRHGITRMQVVKGMKCSTQNYDLLMRAEKDIKLSTLQRMAAAAGLEMVIYFTPKNGTQ